MNVTNAGEDYTLALAREELFLLAGLLQLRGLLGVEDPLLGLLAGEVDERLERARQSLVGQGLLEVQVDGSLAVDAAVGALVQALGRASYVLSASHTLANGASQACLIHLAGDLWVEQDALPNGQVLLTAVRDPQILARRLRDFLRLPHVGPGPGPALTLAEASLQQAQRLGREQGTAAAAALLSQAGVPAAVAPALAAALDTGSLALLRRASGGLEWVEGLAWVAGEGGSWCLAPLPPSDPAVVRLVPAGTAEIGAQAEALVLWACGAEVRA